MTTRNTRQTAHAPKTKTGGTFIVRNVYPTDQVIHIWAHQGQESARNGSNVHFDGPELYSYSTTIAAIIDGIVYISHNNMSATTGRHIAAARSATSHMERFFTTAFSWSGSNPRLTHEAMLFPAARSAVQTLEYALTDSRTRKQTKLNAVMAYIKERERIVKHAARFNISVFMPEMTAGPEAVAQYQEAKRIADEKKEAARLKAQKKQQREDKKQFKVWLTTGAGRFPYSYRVNGADQITVAGHRTDGAGNTLKMGMVVTSQGAECPLDHAVKALKFWSSRLNSPFGKKFEPYHTNGHKIPLGHFTLDSIDESGTVKAGCHIFTAKEIQRFINQWREVLGL